jgi:DNA replication and repair protein RecF
MGDAEARPEDLSPAREAVPLAATVLNLVNFRSYARGVIAVEAAPVVLAGANGTGKTNLLEAISLLSPGRGLRGAKLADLQRKAPLGAEPASGAFADSLWAVSATIARPDGNWEIGTGLTHPAQADSRAARTLHLNGAPAASADIAELVPMLWLTPSLDRLFLEGAGDRRRFLDRLVFGLDSAHARRTARYERAMQERLRLLRDGVRDPVWLDGLEETMGETGSEIARARSDATDRLNRELSARGSREGAFPCATLAMKDGLGDGAAEPETLRKALSASRMRDAESGRTNAGPHTADLDVRHTGKRADARDCSTGEQKALLVSIVLANAWLQKKRHGGIAPLLLLDEIAAHLDGIRRAALFEEILALKTQAWLTGTDKALFSSLLPHAQCFSIAHASFLRED